MTSTQSDRLAAVVDKLSAKRPHHAIRERAVVDGWELSCNSSDFGDVIVSARNGDRLIGFDASFPDVAPAPAIYLGTTDDDLPVLVDLAERAEWETLG